MIIQGSQELSTVFQKAHQEIFHEKKELEQTLDHGATLNTILNNWLQYIASTLQLYKNSRNDNLIIVLLTSDSSCQMVVHHCHTMSHSY